MKNITEDGYWLGLEQLEQDPTFLKATENEFMSSPLKEGNSEAGGVDRRDFMKLMGASIALTSAGCLRRPVEKIIPYNNRPVEITPGVANDYTSALFDGTAGMSLVVKTREGRPLFLKGNPQAPLQGSGLTPRASASVLSLYDPDRVRKPLRNLQNPARSARERISATWESADEAIVKALREGGVRVLTGHNPSPSTRDLLADFARAFGGKNYSWSLQNYDAQLKAQRRVFGRELGVPRPRLERASFLLSVDNDFLSTYLNPADLARGFGERRNPDGSETQSRFVAFESFTQLTGMNADDRFVIKPSQHLEVLMGLMERLVSRHGASVPSSLREALSTYEGAAGRLGLDADKFDALAAEMWASRGRAVVLAGGVNAQTANAVEVQMAALALNSLLNAWGNTLDLNGYQGLTGTDTQLWNLIDELEKDQVQVVILDGSINPGLSFADLERLRNALNKAKLVVSTSNYLDETANLADYVLPAGHPFENWNDYEFVAGTYHIAQPTIRPMYETRSLQDSLLAWMRAAGQTVPNNFYTYMRGKWETLIQRQGARNLEGSGFVARWDSLLHQGYYQTSQAPASSPSLSGAFGDLRRRESSAGIELVLYTNATVGDGSYANNAWMQELPDPVTKIVWDNYLCIAPARAKEMKLRDGDVVRIKTEQGDLEAPVHILPGTHKDVVAIAVGYGRRLDGMKVADRVGVNVFPLSKWENGQPVYAGLKVSEITKAGRKYPLANTQGHHRMEGRQIVVEATAASYAHDKNAGVHRHKFMEDIWTPREYTAPNQWAMTVDLSTCIGCSACMVACQSENNIPVVGKKYVLQGREMSWIRLDRYWRGDADQPDAVFQPMLCQHCENAPCERVCPVLATVHSDEGLNDMVYNRCVGTRYCSNNCPYKVRRFNWFNYTVKYAKEGDTTHKVFNPDVTVRSRGVMEKCTFCVQRIKDGRAKARIEGRALRDGDVQTACEAVCPTQAIVFGDLKDQESRVSKVWRKERQYILLEEQNTQTRVRYLAKVRNADRDYGHHHPHPPEHKEQEEAVNTSGDHA